MPEALVTSDPTIALIMQLLQGSTPLGIVVLIGLYMMLRQLGTVWATAQEHLCELVPQLLEILKNFSLAAVDVGEAVKSDGLRLTVKVVQSDEVDPE